MSGLFVTLEGGDGVGKTTQIKALAARLEAAGRTVVKTREPGGSVSAEAIRTLLLGGRWSPTSELLLLNAARRDHVETVIAPALDRGEIVLCDRFVDSTRAYQAGGRGVSRALVDSLHRLVIGRDPDVTVILDLSPEALAARLAARGGPRVGYDDAEAALKARIAETFRAIAAAEPTRCTLIDASRPVEAVTAACLAAIEARL